MNKPFYYNQMAEKYPMSKKDKEKLVELLEQFYPIQTSTPKRTLTKKKRKKGVLPAISDRRSITRRDTGLDLQTQSLTKQESKKLENVVNKLIARIPGLSLVRNSFLKDGRRHYQE